MLGRLSSAAICYVVVVVSAVSRNVVGVEDPICGVKSTIAAISDLRKDGDD